MSRIFQTKRLYYRRPLETDAQAIFDGFASDPDVTRYVGWPRHSVIDDTLDFIEFSDKQWRDWRVGPVLLECRESGALVGTSGLDPLDKTTATTGYVIAKPFWGLGYATEALRAMLEMSTASEFKRLFAYCHWDHVASRRVLERCGFALINRLEQHLVFPNLSGDAQDVCEYEFDRRSIQCSS